jgi:signal transduction histidine kinase
METLDRQQLIRLLQVGRGLVSELDLEEVLGLVLEAARELTGARYAALGVLDHEKASLERFLFVGIDEEERERIGPLPRGHGILGELINDPRPLRLRRISDHPRSYGFPAEHPEMTTFVGTPVMIRDEVYGNLYLTEKEGGEEFTDTDEHLLAVITEWTAIAIANARAHTSLEKRRQELERAVRGLEATVDLSREVGGETDLERVLELVVKRGRALVDAGACLVLLLEGPTLRVCGTAGEAPPEAIGAKIPLEDARAAAEVLRGGAVVQVERRRLTPFARLGIDATTAMLAPLRFRGRNVGVLVAFAEGRAADFSRDDELLLASFATSAGSAIAATLALEDEKLRLSIRDSEQERRRWARELHDETLQELSALRVLQDSALEVDDVDAMRDALHRASDQVAQVIDGLQELITELRPTALDELGAAAAIESLVDRLRQRAGVRIELDVDLGWESGRAETRHLPQLEATIYRIVQEALNNVIRHAEATRAQVVVEETDGHVRVVVEDDGRGFNPELVSSGFGLSGMRERVELADGDLRIEPGDRDGTRVTATLPSLHRDGAGE